MGLRLHPPEALLDAVATALDRDRRVALVLGSSLSAPAVPHGAARVQLVREAVAAYPALSADLEDAVAEAGWGHEVDAALALLADRAGADELHALAVRAVRQARTADARALPDDRELERDLEGWQVPPGLQALGTLLATGAKGLRGPVLTLGWDPLLAIAILRAGGRVARRVLGPDGTLTRPRGAGEGIELVHLAGFWRDPASLGPAPPPARLAEALAPVVRDHAVVVLGAVPRDDAVLQALTQVVKRDDAQVSLSWAFASADRVQVKTDARRLLQRTESLVRTGRFRTYGGVDGGQWLCDLETRLVPPEPEPEPAAPSEPEPAPAPTLPGWIQVTPPLLQPTPDALPGFAAGQGPTWGIVACPQLAARDRVQELETALLSGRAHKRGWSVHLLLGPDGEGKSTVARQVAARIAGRGGPWRVWWRDQGGLRWDQLGPTLQQGTRVLLVSDGADELLRRRDLDAFLDARKLAGRLQRGGAAVHLLLTASAVDWRRASQQKPRWLQAQEVQVHRSLHELNTAEARRFALAAEATGLAGNLMDLADLDARARLLVEHSAGREHARLLGALAQGRTGHTLEDQVTAWLLGLRGKRSTRFPKPLSAWLHAAALQVAGLGSIDRRILRAVLDCDEPELDAALGELHGWLEPEQQGRSRRVRVTSPAVAAVTLAVMDAARLGRTRAQLHAGLATGAIQGVSGYAKDRRAAAVPRLAERLWRTGHQEDGLAMADAAHAAAPLDAGFARTAARLQRESGDPAAGAASLATWLKNVRADDPQAVLERATLQEWTACARAAGGDDHAPWAAWLALFALSDQAGTKLRSDGLRALLGVADALAALDPQGQEPRAVQGRAAAVAALQHAPKGALGARELQARDAHGQAVDGLWRHLSPGAVGACLSGVARLAWDQVAKDRHLPGLPVDGRLTFQGLGDAVQAQGPRTPDPTRSESGRGRKGRSRRRRR